MAVVASIHKVGAEMFPVAACRPWGARDVLIRPATSPSQAVMHVFFYTCPDNRRALPSRSIVAVFSVGGGVCRTAAIARVVSAWDNNPPPCRPLFPFVFGSCWKMRAFSDLSLGRIRP